MQVIKIIKNNPFKFSFLLLIASFVFSRGPFFIWLPLPGVYPDTFDYYNAVDILLHRPIYELGMQPIELPLGYPLFLILAGMLSNKLIAVVLIQSLFKLFSCVYLAYISCRYYRSYGILVAMALSIYIMNGFTIRWDTALFSESIYSSSLILLTGLIIQALNKNSRLLWLLLGIWLFVPGFIRPNGIYVYFIIVLLFVFFRATKGDISKYIFISLPVILLNLIWATFNVKAYGAFIPGNFVRFTHVLAHKATEGPPAARNTTIAKLKEYLTLPEYPQYYYSVWTVNYESMYIKDQIHDPEYKMYDWEVEIPASLRILTYKEYFSRPDEFKSNYEHIKEHHGIMGIWLFAYHIWYKIDEMLLRNRIIFLFFVITVIYGFFKWIGSKFKNRVYLLFTVFGGLHLLNIAVIAVAHPVVQLRYSYVSEFLVYVTLALLPVFIKEINFQKSRA